MIREYISNLAIQMGFRLDEVSVIEGRRLGCRDMHLLHVSAGGKRVSTLIDRADFDQLQRGAGCGRLEVKVRLALTNLQMLLAQ